MSDVENTQVPKAQEPQVHEEYESKETQQPQEAKQELKQAEEQAEEQPEKHTEEQPKKQTEETKEKRQPEETKEKQTEESKEKKQTKEQPKKQTGESKEKKQTEEQPKKQTEETKEKKSLFKKITGKQLKKRSMFQPYSNVQMPMPMMPGHQVPHGVPMGVMPMLQQQQQQQQQPPQPQPQQLEQGVHALDDPNVYHWICQLTYGPQKEQALLELGRKREQFDDLAVVLWSSFGVMTSLLDEIISVYPMLQPQLLSNQLSNRVCNALVLLQCVASHPETKHLFLQAHIPLFLFPFLNTTSRQRTFEYLRLTSLGVIGALVKNDSQEVINFLLRTDIIPLCLRIMKSSSELSKTVAIFILQKILLDDVGLQYICATLERFYAVTNVLRDMVDQLTIHTPPGRLLKHIIRCYLRLSDNLEARRLLKVALPAKLRDNTFTDVLRDDVGSKRCLAQLLLTLNEEA